jgi:hypothetical protein
VLLLENEELLRLSASDLLAEEGFEVVDAC